MIATKSGVAAKSSLWAVCGSFVACALTIAGAGFWVASGFDHLSAASVVASSWTQSGANHSLSSRSGVQTSDAKTGDENFWLSGLSAGRADGAMHKVSIGDHITINGKSNVGQTLEIVDVKPIAAGLLPVVAGTAKPNLILVTCKVTGQALVGAQKGDAALVRLILEDAPTLPMPTGNDLTNKAL
jgi:hypothetical protein